MEREKEIVVGEIGAPLTEKENNEKLEKIAKFRHEIELLTYYAGGPLTEEELRGVNDRITQLKSEVVFAQLGDYTDEAKQVAEKAKSKSIALQSKVQRAQKKANDAKAEYDELLAKVYKFNEGLAKKAAEALAKEYVG